MRLPSRDARPRFRDVVHPPTKPAHRTRPSATLPFQCFGSSQRSLHVRACGELLLSSTPASSTPEVVVASFLHSRAERSLAFRLCWHLLTMSDLGHERCSVLYRLGSFNAA